MSQLTDQDRLFIKVAARAYVDEMQKLGVNIPALTAVGKSGLLGALGGGLGGAALGGLAGYLTTRTGKGALVGAGLGGAAGAGVGGLGGLGYGAGKHLWAPGAKKLPLLPGIAAGRMPA